MYDEDSLKNSLKLYNNLLVTTIWVIPYDANKYNKNCKYIFN